MWILWLWLRMGYDFDPEDGFGLRTGPAVAHHTHRTPR